MKSVLVPWKKIAMIVGTIGALFSVMVAWEKLEFLPRWAWYNEVAAVQEFAKDTRSLVLNQEWFRLRAKLRELQVDLSAAPRDRDLIGEVTRLEQQLRHVEEQLDQLNK